MKKWLVDSWKAGLFSDDFKLLLTVHDEGDLSRAITREAEAKSLEFQRIGEVCIQLYLPGRKIEKVPLKVDREIGPNWSDLEEVSA